jgi:16S rRNA (guanine527-N7)-methyltransferase
MFLKELIPRMGLDGIDVVVGRAEDVAHMPEYREGFDIVISRAVAPLPSLVELTLPFCTVGGTLITQKKGEVGTEISQSIKAINTLGGNLRNIKRIDLEELADHRQLVIIDKVKATPSRYPRRSGMPAKKPII